MDVKNYLTVFFTCCTLTGSMHLAVFAKRNYKNGIPTFRPFYRFVVSVCMLSSFSFFALFPVFNRYKIITLAGLNCLIFFSYAAFNHFIVLTFGISRRLRKIITPFMLIIPIIAALLSLSDPLTHLFVARIEFSAEGFPVLHRTLLFNFFKLGLFLTLTGTLIGVIRSPVIRFQKAVFLHVIIVVMMFIPISIEILDHIFPHIAGMGFAYFFVTLTAIMIEQMYWGYLPLARNTAVEFSERIYLVFDTFGFCTDLNRKGAQFIKTYSPAPHPGNSDLGQILTLTGVSLACLLDGTEWNFCLTDTKNETRYYRLSRFKITKQPPLEANAIGIIITDVTRFKKQEDMLSEMATWDSLTKVHNRRYFYSFFEHLSAHNRNTSISILMLDKDLFKTINDSYGHLAGDEVLKTVAERCKKCLRTNDVICRFGGEEFLVLFVGSNQTKLRDSAERIRLAIGTEKITVAGGTRIQATVSIGGYCFVAGVDTDADFIIEQADIAMYRAKENGRNQVFIV
jgi:diguanylate cyclase (GGDEF)-like protein